MEGGEGGRVERQGGETGRMEGEKGGMKAGRPTYGDAVVAREPDSYKLPHQEAKSCWEGSTRGGRHGGGGMHGGGGGRGRGESAYR